MIIKYHLCNISYQNLIKLLRLLNTCQNDSPTFTYMTHSFSSYFCRVRKIYLIWSLGGFLSTVWTMCLLSPWSVSKKNKTGCIIFERDIFKASLWDAFISSCQWYIHEIQSKLDWSACSEHFKGTTTEGVEVGLLREKSYSPSFSQRWS